MHVVPPTPPAAAAPEPAPPPCVWTRQQDKLLGLLVCRMYPRWDLIAPPLGDKTPCQACQRYESMVADLRRVLEAPQVETPREWDLHKVAVGDGAPPPGDGGEAASIDDLVRKGTGAPACSVTSKDVEAVNQERIGSKNQKKKAVPQKRNKAVPWSEVEHKLFLEGIRKHGTGGWKRLAREFVVTRSAGQIASHYQKYSIRQAKRRRNECKRPSIHDINDDGTTGAAADQGSGQQPAAAAEGEPESGTTDDVSAGEEEAANYR